MKKTCNVPTVQKKFTTEETQEINLFKRYMNAMVCTVKENPLHYFDYTNSLHKNLQFSLERAYGIGDMTYQDLSKNGNKERKNSYWYLKSTD